MCTEIRFANKDQSGEITSVGGTDRVFGADQPWGLSRGTVVGLIESGRWSFFVNRQTATPPDRVKVQVAQRGATKYLKTEADGDVPNNLLALPEQSPPLTDRPPGGFTSGLPGARTPQFIGLYSDVRPTPLATPNADGVFPVRPARHIFIRFSAPFSNEYEVRVDGGFPLYRAPADTVSLPDPLEQSGWWAFTRTGYFGTYNPAASLQIDRDNTLYEIRVRLPEAVVGAPLVTILLAQLSLNRNCVPPEDISTYLTLSLGRFAGAPAMPTSPGGNPSPDPGPTTPAPPPPTPPTPPSAGVEVFSFIRDPSGQDQFDLTNPGLDPGGRLTGATITTVTNISRDINNDPTIVHFFSLAHTEPPPSSRGFSGVGSIQQPFLRAGATTSALAGLLVNGRWNVRVGNISAVFLDIRKVNIRVAWTRP